MNAFCRRGLHTVVVLALTAVLACDAEIVYRDANRFEDPPVGAGEFLGYSDVTTKRTTCGNCHIGKQTVWSQTAHAGAWQTLQATGSSQPVCQECHAVSSLGNLVTEKSVGWVATGHERYQDVQCESCHGPGLAHVTNPDAVSTKPLAPLAVGADLTRGCGECHSGVHRPFAEEWTGSLHARVIESRATNVSCIGCHEAKGVLQAWGVRSTFMEENAPGEHMAITCAVCHDPHDRRHEGQLRFPMDVASVEQNLCMKCHHKRGAPELASPQRGPHSPEGPLLLGDAGWYPPNFEYPAGALVGSHGSDRNPRLCATCHVTDYELRDPLTNAFTFRATGHSFQAIPCVDESGVPTGERECDITARSFRSCTECHLTESAARSALIVARTRIDRLSAEIAQLLARIPASELNASDNRYSTAEGAQFNMRLATDKRGSVAHNPFLLEALLLASIRQIDIDYGIRPGATVSLEPALTPYR